ncbi:MAG: HK97 family phage prohead protease [Candidatus Methanosuratincola petrocarbonis]
MFSKLLGRLLEWLSAKGTKVQSVLCSKERFKSVQEAAQWCREHNFKADKTDETDNYYRFRQFPPSQCQEGTIRTIELTDGVKATVCIPKAQKVLDEGMDSKIVHVEFPFEVKRDEQGLYVEGYASRELWDRVNDYIPTETAFKALKTYFEHGARICLLHVWRVLAGKLEELSVVEDGIYIKVRPYDWAVPMIESGIVKGFSIGYKLHEWEPHENGRVFKDWSLYEISLVDEPANQGCYFEQVGKMLPKGTKVTYDAARNALIVSGLDYEAMSQIASYLAGLADEISGSGKRLEEVAELVFKRAPDPGPDDGMDKAWDPPELALKRIGELIDEGLSLEDAFYEVALDFYYKALDGEELPEEVKEWTRAFINSLPDAAFAVIEPAYKRGETKNKNARHLPHHNKSVKDPNENSSVDLPHYRNALARVNQIQPVTDSISTEELRSRGRAHLEKHRSVLKEGKDMPDEKDVTQTPEPEDEAKNTQQPTPETQEKSLAELVEEAKGAWEAKFKAQQEQLEALAKTLEEQGKAIKALVDMISELPVPSMAIPVNGVKATEEEKKSVFAGIFGE